MCHYLPPVNNWRLCAAAPCQGAGRTYNTKQLLVWLPASAAQVGVWLLEAPSATFAVTRRLLLDNCTPAATAAATMASSSAPTAATAGPTMSAPMTAVATAAVDASAVASAACVQGVLELLQHVAHRCGATVAALAGAAAASSTAAAPPGDTYSVDALGPRSGSGHDGCWGQGHDAMQVPAAGTGGGRLIDEVQQWQQRLAQVLHEAGQQAAMVASRVLASGPWAVPTGPTAGQQGSSRSCTSGSGGSCVDGVQGARACMGPEQQPPQGTGGRPRQLDPAIAALAAAAMNLSTLLVFQVGGTPQFVWQGRVDLGVCACACVFLEEGGYASLAKPQARGPSCKGPLPGRTGWTHRPLHGWPGALGGMCMLAC